MVSERRGSVDVRADVRLDKGVLTLTRLQATVAGSALAGSAEMRLEGDYPFKGKADLTQFDLATLRLRVGIFGSEMWSDELRARIDRELNLTSYDIIGMTETGGPGLGIECARRAGIHVWEDHYLVEIVEPRTGTPVDDGAEGELVVSTLTREGLPLVRYRTHDLTRVVSRARCDCGRTALRVDRLRGRTDDMVIFKGVNFYPRQLETLLLRHAGLGHEYQIVLDADGGGERLTIVAEAEPGYDPSVAARIKRELHDLLSLSPEIRLCPAGTIERVQGKAVRVVDRRPRA